MANCIRPHGVNGEVAIRIEKGFEVDSVSFDVVFLELQGGLVPFFVDEIREKNPEEAILKFENVTSQQQARLLADAAIYIDRQWLMDDGGGIIPTGTVVGYAAIDQIHGEIGTILRIQEIAKNPLFIVDYQNRELMIPIVEQFIVSVDDDQRKIFFDLPDGLLDL